MVWEFDLVLASDSLLHWRLELVWESGSAVDLEWGVGDVDGNGFGVAVGLDRELRGLDAHTAMLRSRLVISNSEFKRARHARSPLVCLP